VRRSRGATRLVLARPGFDRIVHLAERGRSVEGGEDPGGAGRLPGVGVASRLDLGDEVEGVGFA
jgi:hypothetical protein